MPFLFRFHTDSELYAFKDGQIISGAVDRTYTAAESGAYTVEVTNAGGCSGLSVATELTINGGGPIEITGRTESYCPGESLLAPQSSLYQWFKNGNPVANATLQEFFPDGPGTYTVDVIDLFGCSGSGSVTVNPDTQNPTIALNGAAQSQLAQILNLTIQVQRLRIIVLLK